MSKLTIFNPLQQALKNQSGLERVGMAGQRNWKTTGYCWTCGKDKSRKGGAVKSMAQRAGTHGKTGPQRFTCADCLAASAARKAA